MRKGVLFYVVARYSTVLVGLIINAILSHILVTENHGILAVIVVFTNFFSIIANLGLGTGVIQNKTLSRKETDNIYSFSVLLSIVLGIAFFLIAPLIADFYNDPRYINVVRLLSISVLLNSLNVIPNAVLLKEEKFNVIGVRMIVASTVSGIVAIIIAQKGGEYYALVAQTILLIAIQFIWNWFGTKLKFDWHIDFTGVKKIGNYSFFQFAYSLMLYFSQNLDNLLTGKFFGSVELAYYNKSYQVMRYPIDYIPHTISPVLHPILSKHQDDLDFIYEKYMQLVRVLSLIGVYISLLFMWESEEVLILVFGKQWYPSIVSFSIFGLGIWAQLVNAIAGSIYQSTNNTKNMFISGILHITISLIAIVLGISSGSINYLALYLVISWYIKFFIETFFLVKKSLKQRVFPFIKEFVPHWLLIALVSLVFSAIVKYITFGLFINLIVKGLIITVLFICFTLILGQKKHVDIAIKMIRKK